VQEVKSSYPVNETFDPLSEDYREDPYPYYVKFRREAPVFFAPEINVRVVSRYEDISNIVKDPETFSNALVQEPLQSLEPDFLRRYPECYQHLLPQA
jgi:cytochrome P450